MPIKAPRVSVVLAIVCTASMADAQMDPKQARSYVTHKFSQLVEEAAWPHYSQTVAQIGTPEEKAALARLRLSFAKETYGAPVVDTRCPDTRCTLRMNASFIGLSAVFALSSAASAHLKAAPGLATQCFVDNIDNLARTIVSGGDPYVPLLPCLGKPNVQLQALVDNQRYNDFADIAAIETVTFAFAHELAHVRNGDLDPANRARDIREIEARADIEAVEFLARAGVDAFFAAGATGIFRLAERLSDGARGDYPPAECRVLYAMLESRNFLRNLDRSKLKYDSGYQRQLHFDFFDWKIAEATAFIERHGAKAKDGSCAGYFR